MTNNHTARSTTTKFNPEIIRNELMKSLQSLRYAAQNQLSEPYVLYLNEAAEHNINLRSFFQSIRSMKNVMIQFIPEKIMKDPNTVFILPYKTGANK